MKNKIATIFLLVFVWAISVLPVAAVDVFKGVSQVSKNAFGEEIKTEGNEALIYQRIGTVINVILGTTGTILFVIVIYAGFLWLTAGGNEDQIARSKKYLINSVIGMAILMSAFFISDYILEIATGVQQ